MAAQPGRHPEHHGRASACNHKNSQMRLLEAIVDGSATAYIAVGLDGQVMLANAMARRLLEIGAADIGKPFQDLPVSYRPAELRSRIDEVQATNRPLRLENQSYHRPPAEPIWLTIDISPIHGDDGKLLATLLGFNNTTRAHQLQQELQATQETLETTVEELQSANEELETTNEELQSTNEELGDHQRRTSIDQRGAGDHQRGTALDQRTARSRERGNAPPVG